MTEVEILKATIEKQEKLLELHEENHSLLIEILELKNNEIQWLTSEVGRLNGKIMSKAIREATTSPESEAGDES